MAGYPLTEEQYQRLDTEVTDVMREEIIGRSLIALAPGSPLGIGVQSIKNYIEQDMSAASIDMKLTENKDSMGYTDTTLNIPIIHKEFEIDARDLASSKITGIPLDFANARGITAKVAEKEDELIIIGSDGFNGLYDGAGNDYSTAADFTTAGKAITAVKGAMALLLADKVKPPYNFTMNEEQYAELVGPRATTSDKSELAIVYDMIQGRAGDGTPGAVGTGPGGIYVTDVMSAGTSMLTALPNTRYADLVVAEDFFLSTEVLEKSGNLFGRVQEALVPRIKRGGIGACKISNC